MLLPTQFVTPGHRSATSINFAGSPPDYLITHVYNNDSEGEPLSPFDGPASHKVKDSPHFATGVVRGLRREVDRRGFTGGVHWNKWGRSWSSWIRKKKPLSRRRSSSRP